MHDPTRTKIIQARPTDASTLTAIAFAAKRHWDYPEEWIVRWKTALTVTPAAVTTDPTYAALLDERIVGFCAVQFRSDGAWLEHLWVLPAAMGQGVGRALFAQAEAIARERGATSLKIVGDPHAEKFYERMGARIYGQEPAPMDGTPRFLPLLEKPL